jgi:hypothetical protein
MSVMAVNFINPLPSTVRVVSDLSLNGTWLDLIYIFIASGLLS